MVITKSYCASVATNNTAAVQAAKAGNLCKAHNDDPC